MKVSNLVKSLASELAKEEGGKSQAKIGDVRQLLKLLAKKIKKQPKVLIVLARYAEKQKV